jgi:exodeoxyribonuclease VII large subunit
MSTDYTTDIIIQNEFSVSEISYKIKSLLEENIGTVRIKGEISGLKLASSGHCYFSLKDNNAILAATCWKHTLSKINFQLEEGIEIIATGTITAYAGQSKYQISVSSIEPSGIGAFMKILQERKEKLAQEGLFLPHYKQKIPFMPRKIGIITSITGAVIRDIIHRISDRCPTNLLIWPTSVQGTSAASEVTQAVIGFNNIETKQRPDIIIIARGGGSIEDLWPFNDENLVRAVFASKIPIISAIGHETDYSLLDLVADIRAPTPTAAAEFVVPVLLDLKSTILHLSSRLPRRINEILEYQRTRIFMLCSKMLNKQYVINSSTQKLDELELRLNASMTQLARHKFTQLNQFTINRLAPKKLLQYKYLHYQNLANNLRLKHTNILNIYQYKLELNSKMLESLNYHNVLKRGFSIIKDTEGNIITSAAEAKKAKIINISLYDGDITCVPSN